MEAKRDENHVPALLATSSSDGITPVAIYADPSTHRLYCDVSISNVTVTGGKSNNAAVPGATNLGVLPAIATAAAPTYTEGFQVGLSTDLTGALRVSGSISVGGTTDRSTFTAGGSSGTPTMAVFNDSSPAVAAEGKIGLVRMSTNRNQYVTIRDAAGNERGLNIDSNGAVAVTGTFWQTTQPVSGTFWQATQPVSIASMPSTPVTGTFWQATQPVSIATAPVLVAGSAIIGKVGVDQTTPGTTNGVAIAQIGSTTVDSNSGVKSAGTIRVVIATDQPALTNKLLVTPDSVALPANQSVNVSQINAVTPLMGNGTTGTGSQRVTIASDNSAVAGMGVAATAAAVPANAGYKGAQARSSEAAAATNGNLVGIVADLAGKQIVLPYANPENFVSGAITSAMTGTTTTSLVAAPGAGLRNYITTIIVSNSHATVGTDIIIQDGSGGTTLLTIPAASVYGGAVITLPTPLRQPTANTALFCANVTTGASTKVSAVGYKGA